MKTLLLNISDIHVLSQDKPENEGLVLGKFIEDVEEQKKKFEYDDVYVLISGDLVFAASDESYSKFDGAIVQKLIRILNIDRSHFIIAPGNHDVVQDSVKDVEDSFLFLEANIMKISLMTLLERMPKKEYYLENLPPLQNI